MTVPAASTIGTVAAAAVVLGVGGAWAADAVSVGGVGSAYFFVSVSGVILLATAAFAWKLSGVVGALLVVLSGYWAMGYVARPLLLLSAEPTARFGDPIADVRVHGDYADAVCSILARAIPVFLTVFVFVIAMYGRRSGEVRESSLKTFDLRLYHLSVIGAAGWLWRTELVLSGSTETQEASALAVTMSALTSLAACSATVFLSPTRIGFAVILLSEASWSILFQTKAPFMALLLAFVVRILTRGGGLNARLSVAIAGGFFAMFYAVQNVRIGAGRLASIEDAEVAYPPIVRPFLPVLARFDAFQANVDAERAGPNSYMSASEVVTRIWQSFIPRQLLTEKFDLAGVAWGSRVTPYSRQGYEAGANLAEGPIAEGWVLGGWHGIVIETLVLLVALVVVAAAISSGRRLLGFFGIAMLTQPFLFERGMLGIAEGAGKSAQIALVSALVTVLLVGVDKKRMSQFEVQKARI